MHFKPDPYQVDAVKWLLSHTASGLFLPPGLGKTAISLLAFYILKQKNIVDYAVVIAPLRVTKLVWQKENIKWGFNFKIARLWGAEKDILIVQKNDMYLLNPAGLDWFMANMHKLPVGRRMLICDESTIFKNASSNTFKKFKKVVNKFIRRIILTGTPTPNGLLQLWPQIYILDMGQRLGQFVTHYRKRYFIQDAYNPFKYELQDGADEKIYAAINDIIMHKTKNEVDLPAKRENPILVQMPAHAKTAYKQMKNNGYVEFDGKEIVAPNKGVRTFKMQQIANGCVFDDKSEVVNFHTAKVDAIKDLVAELNTPLLVVYEYTHDLKQLLEAFPGTVVFGLKASDEERLNDEWNAGKIDLMFMQLRRGGHGLNLQEGPCSDIAFYSIPFDLELYAQMYQRLWRRGQKNGLIIHQIIAENTIDETIAFEVLTGKESLQNALLKAMEK